MPGSWYIILALLSYSVWQTWHRNRLEQEVRELLVMIDEQRETIARAFREGLLPPEDCPEHDPPPSTPRRRR